MELKDSQRKFDEKNDVSMSSSSSTKADEGSSGRSTPHTPSLRSSPLHMLTSAFSSSSGGLETEEKRRNRHRQVSLGQAEAPTGIRKLVDAPKIAAVKTSSRHHRSRSQDMNKSPSQSRRNTPVSTPQSSPANLELSQSRYLFILFFLFKKKFFFLVQFEKLSVVSAPKAATTKHLWGRDPQYIDRVVVTPDL